MFWPARLVPLLVLFFALTARAELPLSFQYFEDKSAGLSVQEVASPAFSREWKQLEGPKAVFGPTNARVWIRFSLPEAPDYVSDPVMLEIENGLISRLDLYAVAGSRTLRHSVTGMSVPFAERDFGVVRTGLPTFRLPAPRAPESVYYLAAQSNFPLVLPVSAMPVREFYIHQWKQLLFLGGFFGCLFFAAVFNGFIALSLRSRLYANYFFFVACIGLMFFSQEGLSVQLLWREMPGIAARDFSFFGGLAVFFYAQFVREFLGTSRICPRLDRSLLASMCVSCLGAAAMVIYPYQAFGAIGHLAAVGVNILVLLIAVQAQRKKVNAARFFFLSSAGFNLAMVLFTLQENNIFWISAFASRAIHVGTAIEVLLLSFALADRIRTTNLELARQKFAVVHSEKMGALGRLAGGIAHEINNPLAIIHGNASLIAKLETNPKIQDYAKSIEHTANRISKIVKGMRSLARDSRHDPLLETPLASLLQDAISLCGDRAHAENIKLELPVIDGKISVLCRSSELCQVLLNLFNNAFDALAGVPNPTVTVTTLIKNGFVEIAVTDNGTGIPKELRPKILEPFFTTKEPGKGLGLGLSISGSIVEAHKGRLFLDETAPITRFVFTIPVGEKLKS